MAWYVHFEVTTRTGKVIKRGAAVSDPAKHYGEHLRRFYPTAVKVEWTPMSADYKTAIGPKRTVTFDDSGAVTSRTPDIDVAHVGGHDWKPDPNNEAHAASGTSRAGINPKNDYSAGSHPSHAGDEDSDHVNPPDEPVKVAGVPQIGDPFPGTTDQPTQPVGVVAPVLTK